VRESRHKKPHPSEKKKKEKKRKKTTKKKTKKSGGGPRGSLLSLPHWNRESIVWGLKEKTTENGVSRATTEQGLMGGGDANAAWMDQFIMSTFYETVRESTN